MYSLGSSFLPLVYHVDNNQDKCTPLALGSSVLPLVNHVDNNQDKCTPLAVASYPLYTMLITTRINVLPWQ